MAPSGIQVAPVYTDRRVMVPQQSPATPSADEKLQVRKCLFGRAEPAETAKLYEELKKNSDREYKKFKQRFVSTEDNLDLESTELAKRKELRCEHDKSDEVQEEKCNLNSVIKSCAAAEITPPPTHNKKRRMATTIAEPAAVDADSASVKLYAVKQSLITDTFVQRKNNSAIKPRSSMTDVVSSSTSPSPSFFSSTTNTSIPSIVADNDIPQKQQQHDQRKVLLPKFKRTVNAADTSTPTYPRICDSAPCDTTTTTTTTSQQKDMLVLSVQITTAEIPQRQQAQQPSSSSL